MPNRWDPAEHPRSPIGRFVPTPGPRDHRTPYNLAKAQSTARDNPSWLGGGAGLGWSPGPEIEAYYEGTNGAKLTSGRPLASNETRAVRSYVQQGSGAFNDTLRDTRGNPGPNAADQIADMDDAIESQRLERDTTLYRGVRVGMLADAKPGDQIHDWAYSSTALDPGNTRLFGGDLMEIEAPAGTAALAPAAHGVRHEQGTASEVILGRGAVFEVLDTYKQPNGDDPIVGPYEGARVVRVALVGYLERG